MSVTGVAVSHFIIAVRLITRSASSIQQVFTKLTTGYRVTRVLAGKPIRGPPLYIIISYVISNW